MAGKDLNELISALMDNELSELELHRVLREMENRDEARQVWSRYQMISASMRQDYPIAPHWDVSQSVSRALNQESDISEPKEDESTPEAPVASSSSAFGNVLRFAMAASVTLAVIVGVQYYQQPDVGGASGINSGVGVQPLASNSSVQQTQPPISLRPPIQTATVSSGSTKKVVATGQSSRVIPDFSPIDNTKLPVSDSELRRRLQDYMLRHAENASLNSGRGIMPFARVVHQKEQ